jgi:hypothetical protein
MSHPATPFEVLVTPYVSMYLATRCRRSEGTTMTGTSQPLGLTRP